MGQFKKYGGSRPKDFSFGGGNSGGPKKYGGRDRDREGGRGDRGPKQMHSATCSDCGKRCEIPFRPTGKHPVFCSDCFRNKDDSGSRYTPKEFVRNNRDSYERNSGRTTSTSVPSVPVASGISQKQFDTLEKKLDDILSLLHTQRRDAEFAKEKKAPKISVKKSVAKKVVAKKSVKKVVKKAVKKTSVKKAAAKKTVAKKTKATKKKK